MILTIDIGNTNISLAIFSAHKIVKNQIHNTDLIKKSLNSNQILIENFISEYCIDGVMVSSVVP